MEAIEDMEKGVDRQESKPLLFLHVLYSLDALHVKGDQSSGS